MRPVILVMGNYLQPAEMQALEENFECLHLWKERDPEALLQARKEDIQGIASVHSVPVSRTLIEALPNLEIISQFAVGFDNIDLAAAKERGIAVTNTPDVLTDDTADTGMALLLAVSRRVCEGDMYVRVGKWLNGSMPLGWSPKGKIAGIVGMGRIGQSVARKCEAFGMKIIYQGPRKKDDVSYAYEPNVKKLAENADYLILTCPGGASTRHLINADVLEALGPTGFLINIARGSVVDEQALIKALQDKTILGAGLDVYQDEPRVPEELIKMDNVVLLPHVGSATHETRKTMGELVVKNLMAHFEGEALLTPVY